MIKQLVSDEATLSTPCERATANDAGLSQDLVDTLASLGDAGCLAANQIGASRAVVAYKDDADAVHVMFNPRVLFGLGAAKVTESCLTHEAETKVTRYAKVKVAFDELVDGALRPRKRDLVGWQAQMVQHMIDHCAGKNI